VRTGSTDWAWAIWNDGTCTNPDPVTCAQRETWLSFGSGRYHSELEREKVWSRIHLVPILQAEEDRDLYRRMQAAVGRERAIMRDVPGWEVSFCGPQMLLI